MIVLPFPVRFGTGTVHKAARCRRSTVISGGQIREIMSLSVTHRCWTAIVVAIIVVLVPSGKTDETEYEVHVDKVEKINSNGDYFTYNYTYDKVSEMKFSCSGNVQQHKELNDDYSVKGMVSRAELAEDSEYEVMVHVQKSFCDWMRTVYKVYFYEDLQPVSNFPHYDTCPLPAAEYWIKDYVFDSEPYKDMMSEGRWKVEMMLLKGDEVCSGITIITTVKPVS